MYSSEMSCWKLLGCISNQRHKKQVKKNKTLDSIAEQLEECLRWRTMTIQQVLLLLLLCMWLPHPCHTEMLFRRTPDLRPKSFGGRASGSDGKAIHRQKRGWMWNQFFLLEEYTGSDYQYVGKVGISLRFLNNCQVYLYFYRVLFPLFNSNV